MIHDDYVSGVASVRGADPPPFVRAECIRCEGTGADPDTEGACGRCRGTKLEPSIPEHPGPCDTHPIKDWGT